MTQITRDRLRLAINERDYAPRLPDSGLVLAGVLVPLFIKDGQDHVLLIKRSDSSHRHAGEIAFPGGVKEESDPSILFTALREAYEEVGIDKKDVEVIGELDPAVTSQQFKISPFVGVFPYPYVYRICKDEVSDILEVPVSSLLDPKNFYIEQREHNGRLFDTYFYNYRGHSIWGATARILRQLLLLGYSELEK